MKDFKGRHYQGAIILGCVRWYCKYGISYRDLEEMMQERGVEVDHVTLYRWVIKYAPDIEKRLRWFSQPGLSLVGRLMRLMSKSKVIGNTFIERSTAKAIH
jgi:transposase-like protein